jgi:exonuclease SbcC
MRLHRLELRAFGPYAGTEIIDFDAIAADGGFFLLRGHTGSGKTSILDAICFALYGDLPGARSGGKDHLRSDHASDGAEPWVQLEFSVRDRRFTVERTPVWFRPKKRGTGSVRANATATLQEDTAGTWQTLGSKPQDVGAALQPLLGMDREQFTRVAMLPQGDFAKFLHSTSDERAKLLRKLFDTTVFDRAVELAGQRYRELKESTGTHLAQRQAAVEELVSGLSDRWGGQVLADLAVPDTSEDVPDGTDRPGAPDQLVPGEPGWFAALAAEAHTRAESASEQHREASEHAVRARKELEAAQQRVEDQRALDGYAKRLTALAARSDDEAQLRRQINAHDQAQRLIPFLDAKTRAEAEAARARDALRRTAETSREQVGPHGAAAAGNGDVAAWLVRLDDLPTTDGDDFLDVVDVLDPTLAQGTQLAHAAQQRQNQAATALAVEAKAQAAAARLTSATAAHTKAEKAVQAASSDVEDARKRLETAQQQQVKAPDRDEARAAEEVEQAQGVLKAAERAQTLADRVRSAREQRDAARAEERAAYSAQVALFTQRSKTMAVALAQDLEPGTPCQVCGSVEHPSPARQVATGDDGTVASVDLSESALKDAQRRVDVARELEATRQAELSREEQRHTDAVTAAQGLSVEAAKAAVDGAARTRDELVVAWKSHREALELLASAQQRVASSSTTRENAQAAVEQAQQDLDSARRENEEAHQAARQALAGYPDGQSMVASADATRTAVDRVVRALETLRSALLALRDTTERADAELERTQQAADTVRDHVLPDAQAQAVRSELSALEAERAKLDELASSDIIKRAQAAQRAGEAPPDEAALAALNETKRGAEQAQDAASAAVGAARSVVGDVQRAHDRVARADRELGPLLKQAQTAKSVSELMAGNGENLKGMSLPTYVLAARLETVAEAATHRLAAMGEGRYRLLHQDGKQGNRHSGLGLAVEDAWTGATRAPETLSGGETFMVSLALALGLADVVQEESGGIDVETLFIDEGFGTLDQQTLDDVLDGLDRLREGGRLVGIVSHVPELAERIPTQIRVTKTRTGSTTSVVTASTPG